MRLRDAERGHDGVAGELLDDSAVRDDAVLDAVEVLLHAAARHLWIGAGDESRGPHEVHEQDCGQLSLHPHKCRNEPGRSKHPGSPGSLAGYHQVKSGCRSRGTSRRAPTMRPLLTSITRMRRGEQDNGSPHTISGRRTRPRAKSTPTPS